MSDCRLFYDFIVPIGCAFISGGLTLYGVRRTIKAQRKKDRKDYIRQIKPFLVLESVNALKAKAEKGIEIKNLKLKDDCLKEESEIRRSFESNPHFQLDTLIFSNVGSNVCIIDYIRINKEKYQCYGNTSIKAGEMSYISGFPTSLVFKKEIRRIAIGVYDIQYHLYEFNVEFDIEDIDESVFHDGRLHKMIKYSFIDSNTPMMQ